MATIVNARDVLLQATSPRVVPVSLPDNIEVNPDQVTGLPDYYTSAKEVVLRSSSLVFQVPKIGATSPASITLTAILKNIVGVPTFTTIDGSVSYTVNGDDVTILPAGLTTQTATIQVSVVYNSVTYTDRVTIAKVSEGADGTDGTDGADGVDAVVGLLSNESVTVAANAAGTVLSATLLTAGGTFYVFDGITNKTGDASVSYSVVSESGVDVSIAPTGVYTVNSITADTGTATFRAVYNGVTIDKVYSIAKAVAGVNGTTPVTGLLTNESSVVATDSSGNGGNYSTSGGTFKVYDGTTDKTGSGITYSVASSSGVTISIASTGIYTVTGMSTDTGTATLRAVYNGVTVDKIYTISKSKSGVNGTNGTNGLDAKLLALSATAQTFKYDKTGTAQPASQTISFTAVLQNMSGTATFTCTLYNAAGTSLGTVTLGGTGNTRTLTNTQFGSAAYATITSTLSGITDQVTVIKLQDGADGANGSNAKLLYLSATSQVFQITKTGSNSPASITLTAVAQNLSGSPTFTVASGTATLTGTDTTRTLTYSNMFTDTVTVQVSQDGLTDTITIVKVREGTDGANGTNGTNGTDGIDAVVGFLTNEAALVTANSSGVVSSFSGSGGTFKVYGGITDKTGDAAVTYSVNSATGVSISIAATGVYTITDMSVDTGYATLRAVYNGVVIDKVYTISKSKAGADGSNGTTTYTWVKYGTDATGSGLSDDPTGKSYIGLAYNKTTPVESTIASDYTWSLIKGADGVNGTNGTNGINGTNGADGQTFYTWIKYSDFADGTGLYDTPNDNTIYIGIATNKTSATESTDKTQYVWSRFKGAQGVPGTNGTNGTNGSRGTVNISRAVSTGTWTDSEADLAISSNGYGVPITRDIVTLYKTGTTFSESRYWNGSAWASLDAYVNGNMLVSGTVEASKLNVTSLSSISANIGTITSGVLKSIQVMGGAYTAYAWPAGTGTGYYLGSEGLLLGNYNTGKYFQVEADGDIFAPGLSISGGSATYSGALSAATGSFSGTLTASAINAVNTINIAGEAVTQLIAVNGTFTASTSITTSGGKVQVLAVGTTTAGNAGTSLQIRKNGVVQKTFYSVPSSSEAVVPASVVGMYVDTPTAGTYTYDAVYSASGSPSVSMSVFEGKR